MATVAVNVVPPEAATAQDKPPVRVGGNLKAPVKIRDVKPAYPAEAKAPAFRVS